MIVDTYANREQTMEVTGETVLFVDDEHPILSSLERLFADRGVHIRVADNAVDALAILAERTTAVIVSDQRMPGMTGIELLGRAKELTPDTVRILMTAYADMSTAIAAINTGEVFRFVTKPWDNKALVTLVEEALDRYRLARSLRHSDEDMLLSLAQTIELKDPYTRGHCDRVARYALQLAAVLDLPEELRIAIRHGSWLHDCGKIGIPEEILNKPGALDEDEMAIVKRHPAWGAEVARIAQCPPHLVNIILYHHEKYDGTGYPAGIRGEDIPLEARIVAVADIYDALTSERPYRKAFDRAPARDIMQSMRGTFLDPALLDLFLKLPVVSAPEVDHV